MIIKKTFIKVGDDALIAACRSLHQKGEITDEQMRKIEAGARLHQAIGKWEETDGYEITVDTDKVQEDKE